MGYQIRFRDGPGRIAGVLIWPARLRSILAIGSKQTTEDPSLWIPPLDRIDAIMSVPARSHHFASMKVRGLRRCESSSFPRILDPGARGEERCVTT
jgi:hypothetical protein